VVERVAYSGKEEISVKAKDLGNNFTAGIK